MKRIEKKLIPYGRNKIKRADTVRINELRSVNLTQNEELITSLHLLGWKTDGKSDWEICVYFLKKLKELVEYGIADHGYSPSANLLLLWSRSKHKTSCGYYSMVYTDILNSHGIPCRQIAGWAIEPLPGRSYSYLPADIIINHLTCEARIGNKWILLDPTDGGWYESEKGEKLSALEIQRSLVQSEKVCWKGVAGNRTYCYPGLFAFLLFPVHAGLIPYTQLTLKNFWVGGWFWAMRKDPPLLIHSLQGGTSLFFWRRFAASLSLLSFAITGFALCIACGYIISLIN